MGDQPKPREERVKEARAAYGPGRTKLSDTAVAEWQWVEANRDRLQGQYAGRWIAVAGGRIVGAGTKLSTAMRQAKSAGVEHPFITAFKKAEHRGAFEVPHWL